MPNRKPGRTPAHAAAASSEGLPNPPIEPRSATGRAAARLTLERQDPPEHLFRRLLSAYLSGARSFEVVERPRVSSATREVAREFCRRTRQPQIVRDHGSVLTLTVTDERDPPDMDEALLRLGDDVLAFHREAVESWDRLPLGDDGAWARRDDDVDRESWVLERRLAREEREGRAQARPAAAAWTIVRSLERIADHAVTLGEVGPRLADLRADRSPVRELRQLHRQAMTHLADVLRSSDGSRANDLLDVGEALVASGRSLAERVLPAVGDGSMSPATAAAVARALEAIGRTVAYSQDIAQACFDRSLSAPPRTELGRATPPPQLAAGTVPA